MLGRGREFLARKGLAEARLEAELLVAHALGLDRLRLFLALERPVQPAEVERARALLMRRAAREPVAHLTGTREFYGRPFAVDRRVLIPRPETELLIDLARARAGGRRVGRSRGRFPVEAGASEPDGPEPGGPARSPATLPGGGPAAEEPSSRERTAPRVVDYGTGSGCLAITAALELEGARVLAVDDSAEALEVARANAGRLGAEEVAFELAEAPEELSPERLVAVLGGAPNLVLSNPPYVRPDEREGLAPEVRDHEPALALFAPEGDPDHWVRRLAGFAAGALAPGGALLCELGADQGERALELARAAGLEPRLHRDLAGVARVLEAVRAG